MNKITEAWKMVVCPPRCHYDPMHELDVYHEELVPQLEREDFEVHSQVSKV